MASSEPKVNGDAAIERNWGKLKREGDAVEEQKQQAKADEPQISTNSKAAALWTRARNQMKALEDRAAKRLRAEEARLREREASLQALRKEAEDVSRRNMELHAESKHRREEELKLEEEKRAEARRREREQRETMAPTVQFEEVWEVF